MRSKPCRLFSIRWAAALALVITWSGSARAQTGAIPSPLPSETLSTAPRAGALGTVVVASQPRDYLAEIRANFTPQNRAYSNMKTALRFASPLYGVLAGLLLLFSGLSAKMRDIAHRAGGSRWLRILIYLGLYTIVSFILSFPIVWWDEFVVEHRYGLSHETMGHWLGDQGKAAALGVVFLGVIPLVWLVYTAIQKSPRWWWLWLSLGVLPIVLASTVIEPLVVDPVFNKFTPLREEHLKGRILALAARAGIPQGKVYEVDKSQQTTKFNAYVNGFGGTQRVVLWDTTLKGMTEDEILYVVGHEIGHYKLGHIRSGIAFTTLLCFLLFFVTARIAQAAADRYGPRWGFTSLADIASMPLLYVVLNVVVFLSQPLIYARTRGVETAADLYGLELTHENDAAARAFIKLGAQNKSNPEPSAFVKYMLYSHPPDVERVKRALTYRPWATGAPNRYFKGSS